MRPARRPLIFVVGVFAGAACEPTLEIGRRQSVTVTDAGVLPPPVGDAPVAADVQEPTDVPVEASPPTLLWSTGFEAGDVSDWQAGGVAIGGTRTHAADTSVVTDQAHGGARAYRIGLDTTDGLDHMAELYRRVEPAPAYYSAWFLLPEARVPPTYWTLFYFFYETKPGDATTRRGLWDVNLNKQIAYFYDEQTRKSADAYPRTPYPVGRWFHLEAYLAVDSAGYGHVTVWQDGQQILDNANLPPAPSPNLYWGIGSETNGWMPPMGTVYIDDAAISTTRLGP